MHLEFTTELDAVNSLLQVIGEAPVSTLENLRAVDAITALRTLRRESRSFQTSGWNFNRVSEYKLTVQSVSPFEISLPPGILSLTTSRRETDVRAAQHGTRLFNKKTNNYSFEGISSVYVDIIFHHHFDLLSEAQREYVTIKASRRFQDDIVTDDAQHVFKQRDELAALLMVRREERRNSKLNMFNNMSSHKILNREPRG